MRVLFVDGDDSGRIMALSCMQYVGQQHISMLEYMRSRNMGQAHI